MVLIAAMVGRGRDCRRLRWEAYGVRTAMVGGGADERGFVAGEGGSGAARRREQIRNVSWV